MGNVHVFAHRVTALSMACLASVGLILCALSGFNCSFLSINAQPGRQVMTPWGQEFVGQELAFIGIKCESPFYEETDRMWNLSQIFFLISLACGSLTTAMAWSVSLCVAPNSCNWRCLSMMAAVTAVMGVPIFLIFESEPCNIDINRQTCSLALGSYFNIGSVILWVVLTLWTQCLNPPNWSSEVDAWKTSKMNINEITILENGTDGSTSGPKDFNGEIFVTSNDDGLAVWKTGSGHRGQQIVPNDAASVVSSISDGEKERKVDIEAPAKAKHQTVLSTTMEDADDQDIRKGAAIVINALREKTKSLRQPAQSYQLPRFEVAATGATSKNNTGGESDRDRLRGRALIDSDDSALTDDQSGAKVSFTCPDGMKREASYVSSCFAGHDLAQIQEGLSFPEDPLDTIAALYNGIYPGPEVLAENDAPKKFKTAPVSSVAVGNQQTRGDDGSELTTGLSETTPADSEMTHGKDPIFILEDLARTY